MVVQTVRFYRYHRYIFFAYTGKLFFFEYWRQNDQFKIWDCKYVLMPHIWLTSEFYFLASLYFNIKPCINWQMYNLETDLKVLLAFRFLWIMGASMAISLRSYLRSCISRKRLFLRVLLRSVTLVALGVILNSSGNKKNSITNLRLPGVLQRIGLAYFVVASLETVFMKPQGSFEVQRCIITARNVNEDKLRTSRSK